jgi:hypothetical protein
MLFKEYVSSISVLGTDFENIDDEKLVKFLINLGYKEPKIIKKAKKTVKFEHGRLMIPGMVINKPEKL